VKNHPLPDGNTRCAFLATVEFVEPNADVGQRQADPDETDQVTRGAASGDVSDAAFREWIAARCG